MQNKQFSETELRSKYIDLFNNRPYISCFPEVPVFSRSVDLVLRNTINNDLTAVEFKLRDWKHAIEQAKCVRACFDYIYICLPKPRTQRSLDCIIGQCKDNNLGLIVYDDTIDNFYSLVKFNNSINVWGAQKMVISEYLEGKVNV